MRWEGRGGGSAAGGTQINDVGENCVKKNCPEPARGCQRPAAIFNSTKASENQKEQGEKKKRKKYCIGVTAMDPAPNPIEPRGNCRNYKQELPARRRGGKIK